MMNMLEFKDKMGIVPHFETWSDVDSFSDRMKYAVGGEWVSFGLSPKDLWVYNDLTATSSEWWGGLLRGRIGLLEELSTNSLV